eukprot:Pompholyxophrys_sp_v1_NODE_285_length_859_cov_34.747512.p2 type:complete len:104 gc:universal NODE_285_length_859_cov_34.747512:503-192(-)
MVGGMSRNLVQKNFAKRICNSTNFGIFVVGSGNNNRDQADYIRFLSRSGCRVIQTDHLNSLQSQVDILLVISENFQKFERFVKIRRCKTESAPGFYNIFGRRI